MTTKTDSVALDFDLAHPPEKVWRALTDPQLLSKWLLPVANLRLEPGAEFTFKAPPQPGWDGLVSCRMSEIERFKRLSYSWVVGDIDTIVTFTLARTSAGTRLSVVQTGFRENQKRNSGGARYGWKMMGERLVDLLLRIP